MSIVPMQVWMRMGSIARVMDVLVNPHQGGSFQQRDIVQHLERRSLASHAAALEHVAAIRNIFQSIQVVRGGDTRSSRRFSRSQQSDNLGLAEGIERRAGLVQKQHLRIGDQYRSQRNAFLLSPESRCGARSCKWPIPMDSSALHPIANLRLRPAQLQRSKGHFIEDAGIEKLDIGILKDKPTRRRKRKKKPHPANARSVRRSPRNEISPPSGNHKPASKRSRVDLPDPLAPSNATRSPVATCIESPFKAGA